MRARNLKILVFLAVAGPGLGMAFGASPRAAASSQDRASQDRPAGQPDKPAEEVYKNIQIFKGIPSQGVMRAMGFFRRSLGVECAFCHVPPTFEKDDKPNKLVARKMYRMVQLAQKDIGSNKVSCYMCHRGHEEPEPMPETWKAELDKAMKEADQDSKPAEQVYSNIQVFKGVPSGRIMVIMGMFSRSLGVECSHCHVEGEFEKDDKPAKQVARKMLKMTGDVAREFFDGKSPVGCYTCHRGQKEPVAFPAPQAQPPEKKGS
jgi:hypothetical protein